MKIARINRNLVRLAMIVAVVLGCYWYYGHRPLAYHNGQIRDAVGHALDLEISLVPQISAEGKFVESKPPMRITDRTEIDDLLRRFVFPWHARSNGLYHECCGNVFIRINMPDATSHLVRFDHGHLLHPIVQKDQYTGFSKLSDRASSSLVEYFLSKGYTREDLGMSKGK